ncbi:MAG: thrombospondin type 3 repeat-containing protein [Acidobacteriota bacterium]
MNRCEIVVSRLVRFRLLVIGSVLLAASASAMDGPVDESVAVPGDWGEVWLQGISDWREVDKLNASDGLADDGFGRSATGDDQTLIIGAPWSDDLEIASGSVYVFERQLDGTFTEISRLKASDPQFTARFGYAVALDGDTLVVGAIGGSLGGIGGAAYVFERDLGGPDTWLEVRKITPPVEAPGNAFGTSVAISGDTIAIGATENSVPGTTGTVYLYGRDVDGAGAWGLITNVTASDAEEGDFFGGAVALHDDVLVVGEDSGSSGDINGAAYVYLRDEGGTDAWGEVLQLVAFEGALGDRFGNSVALNADRIVVGARTQDLMGRDSGAVYVFERLGERLWVEDAVLHASDAGDPDQFGFAVSLSDNGGLLAITAYTNENGTDSGSCYVFERDLSTPLGWFEIDKLVARDADDLDLFGSSVVATEQTILIGARQDDDLGEDSGSAYVFELPRADTDGDGIIDSLDNCPADPNPMQEDVDGDELGDPCDPDIDDDGLLNEDDCAPFVPGEQVPEEVRDLRVTLGPAEEAVLTWVPVVGARHLVASDRLDRTRVDFDLGLRSCTDDAGIASTFTHPDDPFPDRGWWYLIVGANDCGAGSAGVTPPRMSVDWTAVVPCP